MGERGHPVPLWIVGARVNVQICVMQEAVEFFELAPGRGAGRRMGDLAALLIEEDEFAVTDLGEQPVLVNHAVVA